MVLVSDGLEVLRAFSSYEADVRLVILDLDMPRMDGARCLARLRETRPSLPAILMSGLVDVERGAEFPVDTTVLRKPFPMTELLS